MKKGNTQKALMFAGAGAVVGFGASKLMKAGNKKMIIAVLVLAAVGGVVGYKQS